MHLINFDGTHGHSVSYVVFPRALNWGAKIQAMSKMYMLKSSKKGFFIPLLSFSSILASSF